VDLTRESKGKIRLYLPSIVNKRVLFNHESNMVNTSTRRCESPRYRGRRLDHFTRAVNRPIKKRDTANFNANRKRVRATRVVNRESCVVNSNEQNVIAC